MKNYGDNCKYCLCSRCKHWKNCGEMNGNTEEWCEEECLGENSTRDYCSEFEREIK